MLFTNCTEPPNGMDTGSKLGVGTPFTSVMVTIWDGVMDVANLEAGVAIFYLLRSFACLLFYFPFARKLGSAIISCNPGRSLNSAIFAPPAIDLWTYSI